MVALENGEGLFTGEPLVGQMSRYLKDDEVHPDICPNALKQPPDWLLKDDQAGRSKEEEEEEELRRGGGGG